MTPKKVFRRREGDKRIAKVRRLLNKDIVRTIFLNPSLLLITDQFIEPQPCWRG